MFFEKKRQRGRGESENGNKGRRNKSKQAVEGKTLSLSLSLFSALTLAAGCDTSISRRMALPSLVSTMPGFGFEVVSFFFGGGYGGVEARRRTSETNDGKKLDRERPLALAPLSPSPKPPSHLQTRPGAS
jgi:hypothetical protein